MTIAYTAIVVSFGENDYQTGTPAELAGATLEALRLTKDSPSHFPPVIRAMSRDFVNFSIVGAQKGGTTSLDRYLSQHPQIRTAPQKEVHFFDLQFERGHEWYESQFPIDRDNNPFDRDLKVGEASPYYLFHPCVPERMASVYPGIKLIVMLREPVDRAISHYHHAVRHGFEPLSFAEAIVAEPDRLRDEAAKLICGHVDFSYSHQHHSYLARGRYLEQIQCWEQFFPRSQFLYTDSACFFADPEPELLRVCDFLGVEPFTLPEYPSHNPGVGDDGAIDPAIVDRLTEEFRPHNRALFDWLDLDFGWPV